MLIGLILLMPHAQRFSLTSLFKDFLLTFQITVLQLFFRKLAKFSLGICLACLMTLAYYNTMV